MANIDNFKPNSYASKSKSSDEKKKEIEKLKITAPVPKEKSLGKKVVKTFLSEDISDVKSYVVWDVVMPGIKDFIWDVLSSTVDSLFGRTSSKKGSGSYYTESWRRYNKVKSNPDIREDRIDHADKTDISAWEDIDFDNRGQADYVLDMMKELIKKYDNVSVLEYCGLANREGKWTWDKYGWTNLDDALIKRTWGGRYEIRLPRPIAFE